MRFFTLFLCALVSMGAQTLQIGSDLGNHEGFLDLLKSGFAQDRPHDTLKWQPPPFKRLCHLDGLLLSKSALQTAKLTGRRVFKELWFVLGLSAWKTRLHASSPQALARALYNPALAPYLKPMRALEPYKSTDLLLIPARLYLKERSKHPFPPLLYKIYVGYFWAQPCKNTRGEVFYHWLKSHQAKDLLRGFRVDYQRIFAP
ncbi:hypothetical protein [Helicobacter felis]|uniref:hypothetical protein n=1 Tax=Helicobacter felis TaxID=214 RepID=UPI000CF0F4DF|nr:hypothetical protein [Helicobacter felis]